MRYKTVIFLMVNFGVFVILRYASIFTIVFSRVGPNAKYSLWDFVPAYVLQLLVLAYFTSMDKWRLPAMLAIGFITFLFFGRHLGFVSNNLVPS